MKLDYIPKLLACLFLIAGCQLDAINQKETTSSDLRSKLPTISTSMPAPVITNADNVIHANTTTKVSISWTSLYPRFFIEVQDLTNNKSIILKNDQYLSKTIYVSVTPGHSYSFSVNGAPNDKYVKNISPEDRINFSVLPILSRCREPLSRSCTILNGAGTQVRTCSNGVYSSYSNCNVVSCNTNYSISGNSCVANISGSDLLQGLGFNNIATNVPAPEVTTGAGADAKVLAHWDVVPFQTFSGKINVGVLAYHFNGIKRVDFSADNGPWVSVYLPTANPQTAGSRPEQTAVEEYWVTLDAKNFRNGPVEIRAIAYPNGAGKPVVLQGPGAGSSTSLILNADINSVLPHEVRYATKTGKDENDCKTEATACLSLWRTVNSAGISSEVDGAEIHLGKGSWNMPELGGLRNTNRWLTFSSIPGSNPEEVVITGVDGNFDSSGMYLKLVHFKNVTFTNAIAKTAWNFEDYLWFDHVSFRNQATDIPYDGLRTGNNYNPQGWASIGVFHTDVYMDNMGDGPRSSILARNVFADHTGGGHASGSETVVNYTVNVIFGSGYSFPGGTGIDYHGDLYQFYGRTSDVILYGIRTTAGAWTSTRGFAGDNYDVAIVKSDIYVSGYAFSFCNVNHLIVQQTRIQGASDWCGESGVSADPANIKDVLIDRSTFINGHADQLPHPVDLPGVKVKN
jgi:hypothetical protein